MSGIFDSHAHYTDGRFETKFEGGVSALLSELFSSGVDKILNVGTNTANSIEVIKQASEFDGMYAVLT